LETDLIMSERILAGMVAPLLLSVPNIICCARPRVRSTWRDHFSASTPTSLTYLRFGNAGKPSFLRELTVRLGGDEQTGNFCRYYYWRTVRGQPAGMAAKVARQFHGFLSNRALSSLHDQ
jgi:hypothetical protein